MRSLKQYQKLGERKFTLDEFRDILGIGVDKYLLFADFKRGTILQAQKEFSRQDKDGAYFSDINFTFDAIKTGRKVTGIKFNIFSQSTRPAFTPKIAPAPQEQGEQPQDETIIKLVEIGISKVKADKYLSKYGTEYLKSKIILLIDGLETGLVKSPAGYLTSAIIEDWTSEKVAEKKIKEEKRAKEEKIRFEKVTKELRENQIINLEREFSNLERGFYLKSLSEEQQTTLLEEYKAQAGFTGKYAKDFSNTFAGIWLLTKIENYEENKKEYIKANLSI